MPEHIRQEPKVLVSTENLTEQEWLAYRRRGIGGSDVAAIFGISPFRTARDLYDDKLNIASAADDAGNWVALEMGHLLEPLVAQIFTKKTGLEVFQIKKMFQHPQYPFMMNRDAEDDAFEVSSDSETVDSFSEEFEPVEPPKPEPQAEDAEEARKKAKFDAAEAKRKAEWEAKQAQKKLREQQELDRLAAMSDDDVMQASMNRVSQDTERLTRRNMKLCVMEDVQTECLADPAFARLVMNPKKKMVNCFHYINRKAREYLEQEMKDNDEKPMGGGFGGDVPDELCYQWAREYFRDADAKEDAELEEKFISKTYTGKAPKAGKKEKPKKAAPKPAPKPADEEQLTFGDFSTEEAAG